MELVVHTCFLCYLSFPPPGAVVEACTKDAWKARLEVLLLLLAAMFKNVVYCSSFEALDAHTNATRALAHVIATQGTALHCRGCRCCAPRRSASPAVSVLTFTPDPHPPPPRPICYQGGCLN